MSSRHQPTAGADSEREYADPRDASCDYCGRTIYTGLLSPVKMGSISWMCSDCKARSDARYALMTDGLDEAV